MAGQLVSRGFEANFDEPANDQEGRIKAAIDEHRTRMTTKLEKDLFSQKTRLVNAQRSIKEKETKKAREDMRIAANKIATLSTKLSDLRSLGRHVDKMTLRCDRLLTVVAVAVRVGWRNMP